MASGSETNKYLGIEGGGTRTVALLAGRHGEVLRRVEAGPANLKLVTDVQLTSHFRALARALPRPDALAIGLAGAWAESDRTRIRRAAAKAWPGVPCHATNDLETALAAAGDGQTSASMPQVLIISGTGSACYGKSPGGRAVKVDGWGHMLGDSGSGYDIGLRALRAVAEHYDEKGGWSRLGAGILRSLQLHEPNDLINWAQAATKGEIAGLAREVFAAWAKRDKTAGSLLNEAAGILARHGALCARKLTGPRAPVQFVLTGGILLKQPRFAELVGQQLHRLWPRAVVTPLRRESVWGAVELAKQSTLHGAESKVQGPKSKVETQWPGELLKSRRLSPTEARNRRSMNLDRMPLRAAIPLMLSEEAKVPGRMLAERRNIERAAQAIVRAFRRGGRLFYVGAGTSGRLGVLDASECPPTFSVPPEMVQGIIAGGHEALWKSLEGAEDDSQAGARAIDSHRVQVRDVVVGIAASGTTPFVWGALRAAKQRRATTVLLCFNPHLRIPRALKPAIVIAPNLGPEVLTGSTRLKAGTATKLILNLFTTLAMVQLGKVMSNLMVDVNPGNVKLRDRALRIVRELTGSDSGTARAALEQCGWAVKRAVSDLLGRRRVVNSRP
jgi:N-acetylmuramic acid 6-phosphate etherase